MYIGDTCTPDRSSGRVQNQPTYHIASLVHCRARWSQYMVKIGVEVGLPSS